MTKNILFMLLMYTNLISFGMIVEYEYYAGVANEMNNTLMIDFVQQRALYEECMALTYHTVPSQKVDRRLLK